MEGRIVDVQYIVNSLVSSFRESGRELPQTSEDKRVQADKEGMIGLALAEAMGGQYRSFNDALMVFNGRRYEMIKAQDVKRVISGFLVRMGVGPAYIARSVESISRIVLTNAFVPEFEPRRNVVFMRNCAIVLDGDGGVRVEDSTPELMSNIYLDIPYVAHADCPRWCEFLDLVIGDGAAVRVLQEFLGAMFVDKDMLSIEKALYLYGNGSNGKSVIFETLLSLLGDNMVNADLSRLNGTGSQGDYFGAELVGKLLCYNSEAEAKDVGSGRYKQLISKEKIMVRSIRMSPFESDDWPMFIVNTNKAIITTDGSDGFWRRNMVIRFDRVFSDNPDPALGELKADKSFKYSLRQELPGIFNWILEGRRRILAQRGVFTSSWKIDSETQRMREQSTSVLSFLADKGYVPRDRVKAVRAKMFLGDLYREYVDWCVENGYREYKNRARFRDDLEGARFSIVKSLRIGDRVTVGVLFFVVPKDEEDPALWGGEDEEDLPV